MEVLQQMAVRLDMSWTDSVKDFSKNLKKKFKNDSNSLQRDAQDFVDLLIEKSAQERTDTTELEAKKFRSYYKRHLPVD